MFDPRKVPVSRILFPFAGAAMVGFESDSNTHLLHVVVISAVVWVIMLLLFQRSSKFNSRFALAGLLFKVMAFILFLLLGYGTGRVSRPADPELKEDVLVVIRGEILEEPLPGVNHWTLEMKLLMVAANDTICPTRTKLKVYLEIPPDSTLPAPGELWQLVGRLSSIRNSGNPGEPDYEAIMQRKGYWYNFNSQPWKPWQRKVEDPRKARISAIRIRRAISDQWSGEVEAVSLLKAVCLGDRSGLSNDLHQSYSAAGGIHLLAVSGLHVGLIWWVLNLSLSWTVRLFRKERYRAITIILLLWGYAFVTGFSSSVSRSVTMFTLFTIARLIDQRTHPVNGILLSAFLLIQVNPGRLMEVGFQLSYSAILGIVILFPVFSRLWKVKHRILKWIWEGCLVSLAAQLSTAPLVIYYFHQLPVYALFTNLVAIPLLTVMVALFVISIPLMLTGLLTGLTNVLLIRLGLLMNHFMELMASLPGALLRELYIDRVSLWMLMILGLLTMSALIHRSVIPRYLILFCMAGLLGWNSWTRFKRMNSSEMVVAHLSGCSLITFREGLVVEHYSWCRDGLSYGRMDDYISMAWNKRRYNHYNFELRDSSKIKGRISGSMEIQQGLWRLGNDRIRGWVITGSPGQVPLDFFPGQTANFILFSCEPRIGTFVYKGAGPCDLIADGSNRRWYLSQLESGNDPIHITGRRGAYIKRW